MEVQNATSSFSWSRIVKEHDQPKSIHTASDKVFVGNCSSTKGIAVAVVDTGAIIQGGEKLIHCADRFVSVPEVISEVRDPTSRHSLNCLPFTIDTMEPDPDALKKVINFARATGDLQTLSDVDLKLIALTYTLEAQFHGTGHLRDSPPPIQTVNVKRLREKDMPGWGDNVPNLEEWDALDHASENVSNPSSRILPLKELSLNATPIDQQPGIGVDTLEKESELHSCTQKYDVGSPRKPRRYLPRKTEVKIEGKKMVADGVDASQGQFDEDAGDWRPAVCRSTHRRYLRRKARREMLQALSEDGSQQDASENMSNVNLEDERCPDLPHETANGINVGMENSEESENINDEYSSGDVSINFGKLSIQEESLEAPQVIEELNCSCEVLESNKEALASGGDGVEIISEGMKELEHTSQTDGTVGTSSNMGDSTSGQSWMLRSLSDSSVACVTGDFAMQNVLLQMGLRLLAQGGMQIHELQRWILKCHACFKVTKDIGRIFCPSCGNGGTLRKVAVTVGENGIVLAARRPRISLRGTKFSLPLPQGGRDAITKNPILREDQLPQKFLFPKTKKKNKQGEDIFTSDEIFLHHTNKKAPLQPPVRKALAVFSGKRNPNDNHYSRALHSLI